MDFKIVIVNLVEIFQDNLCVAYYWSFQWGNDKIKILLMLFIFSCVGTKSDEKDEKTAFCYLCSEVHPCSKWAHTNLCSTCVLLHSTQIFDGFYFSNLWKYLSRKYLSRKCSKNCSGPKRTVQRTSGRMKLTSRNKSTLIFHF